MQADFFQAIPLFSQASKISLDQLSYLAKRTFYKKGAAILDRYQSQQTFLYVINGWIKLFKESTGGEAIIIDILTRSHYCGETFLFNSNKEDSYAAQSISDLEIFTLPISSLKQLIMSDHNLSINFLQEIIQKQNQLNVQIEHLSIQNAMQRIGCFLLRLRDGSSVQKNIKLPYDKALLALRLGMKPETFSRALRKLSNRFGIHVENEYVDIPCPFNLIRYVCQHCSQISPSNITE